MNFNVYVSKDIANQIAQLSKELHRSRNSIIREALEAWIKQHQKSKWPSGFFDYEPQIDVPDFKELRRDLKKAPKDPLK